MAQNEGLSSLSRTQERALEALISQPTIPLAAGASKVSVRTIYRWLEKDDAFKAEYLRLRREIVNNAVFQIQKAANNAVNVVISLMNDPETPASVRLGAARATLEMCIEALKAEFLEERIQALEEQVAKLGTMRPTNGRAHTFR